MENWSEQDGKMLRNGAKILELSEQSRKLSDLAKGENYPVTNFNKYR